MHHCASRHRQLVDELAIAAAVQPKTLQPNVDANLVLDLRLDVADGASFNHHEQQTRAPERVCARRGGHLNDRAALKVEGAAKLDAVGGRQAAPCDLPVVHDEHLVVATDASAVLDLGLDIADVVAPLEHQGDRFANRGRDKDLARGRRGSAHGGRRGPAHDHLRSHAFGAVRGQIV
jgi:hypothetical protein